MIAGDSVLLVLYAPLGDQQTSQNRVLSRRQGPSLHSNEETLTNGQFGNQSDNV